MPRRGPLPRFSEPGITLEEAIARKLWGIFQLRRGSYVVRRAGTDGPGALCGWALDLEAAHAVCQERRREDAHPDGGRHQDHDDNKRRRVR